jgi:hypothetical protein
MTKEKFVESLDDLVGALLGKRPEGSEPLQVRIRELKERSTIADAVLVEQTG